MTVKKRHRFRFYPTPEQERKLAGVFGCVRFVYNKGLEFRKSEYEAGRKVGFAESSRALTAMKREDSMEWLREPSSVPLQQALRHLNSAYSNFFRKNAKFPKFKSK